MTLRELNIRTRAFLRSDAGRRTKRIAKAVFTVGIVVYLGYELTTIGWQRIWDNLPTQPLFYLLFALLYLQLPITEVLIYRVTWDFDGWRSIPAFIKKRVINRDVFGYAGEVYFFTWANEKLNLSKRRIAETIRDNNIISSIASTLIAVVLVGIFLYAGRLSIADWIGEPNLYYIGGGVVLTAILIPIAIRFRRYLFSMSFRVALLIFAIQCVRLLMGQAIQIWQWDVAMPEVGLSVWFTYAAAGLIITRIPFVPNQDLIFMAAGIRLGQHMNVSEAGIAGMLVMIAALGKVVNFAVLAGFFLWDRAHDLPVDPDETDVTPEGDGTAGTDVNPDAPVAPETEASLSDGNG